MRTLLPIRHRYAFVACALLSAAALGTVTASAATATGPHQAQTTPGHAKHVKPGTAPEGVGLGVAYTPTGNAPDDVNDANPKFAACMKEQGQKYFPDFHASKDEQGKVRLNVRMRAGKGFDPTSDAYEDALKACAPILKKAGLTLTDAKALPPLPGKPGKVGGGAPGEGPSLHTEPESLTGAQTA
ncbi:hypothetical protein OHT59_13625 [Streptomyces sp. NBC_00243]|uniref:hypothetical protein n=1 Tax=Streptomyces sp. NBC_00243 TaxID=2975688 RepID=UPI002DDC368F|nr:hypothetical protein [Streptomyces sp. NBC_00243]WRZ19456.1 hypothetical protein OHT59_13625 [Streptomyces sp. NBC_00243]